MLGLRHYEPHFDWWIFALSPGIAAIGQLCVDIAAARRRLILPLAPDAHACGPIGDGDNTPGRFKAETLQ